MPSSPDSFEAVLQAHQDWLKNNPTGKRQKLYTCKKCGRNKQRREYNMRTLQCKDPAFCEQYSQMKKAKKKMFDTTPFYNVDTTTSWATNDVTYTYTTSS